MGGWMIARGSIVYRPLFIEVNGVGTVVVGRDAGQGWAGYPGCQGMWHARVVYTLVCSHGVRPRAGSRARVRVLRLRVRAHAPTRPRAHTHTRAEQLVVCAHARGHAVVTCAGAHARTHTHTFVHACVHMHARMRARACVRLGVCMRA